MMGRSGWEGEGLGGPFLVIVAIPCRALGHSPSHY